MFQPPCRHRRRPPRAAARARRAGRCWTSTVPRWTGGASSRPRWWTRWPRQDLLRLLLPRSLGGQEIPLLDFCKTCEAVAWADASAGWFVNQSNVSSATSAAAMPHEAAAAIFDGPRAGPGMGRQAQQQHRHPRGGRLSPDRHLELRQRRTPHQVAGRAQLRAESRRHAASALRPAGRPHLPVPARAGRHHRRLAGARPARHRQRHLFGQGSVRARCARAGARHAGGAAGEGADLSHRLDPALCQRLLQRDPGPGPAPARDLYRAGARPTQPRLDHGHGKEQFRAARDRHSRGQALGGARLPARGGRRRSTRPRQEARSTSTCACVCGSRPPSA